MNNKLLLLLILLITLPLTAQNNDLERGLLSINKQVVEAQLQFLASDWMEGRETGEEGQYLAADYIASMFQIWGLKPAGDMKKTRISYREMIAGKKASEYQSYFQDFNLIEYYPGENQELSILSEEGNEHVYHFNYKTDFSLEPANIPQELTSEVVFVGYGYVNEEAGYNDFKGLDVRGKIILMLDGLPGENYPESEAYKKLIPKDRMERRNIRYQKRNFLHDNKVAAVIRIDLDEDPVNDFVDNVPFRYNQKYYEGKERLSTRGKEYDRMTDEMETEYTTLTLSNRALKELLRNTGLDLEAYAKKVAETAKPDSRVLEDKKVYLKTDVVSRIVQTRNVLAKIEGEDRENIVVIGGHYDHEGERNGFIYNGADDNASGTVGVMTIAKAMVDAGFKPKYTLVFAAWSGEERGLHGSYYFTDKVKENVILYLNYDMISRDNPGETEGNQARFVYNNNYPVLKDLTETQNSEKGIGLQIEYNGSPKPLGGSDHSAFTMKNVPIIYYMAGWHDDYHTPIDHVEYINYEKMIKIIKMGYLSIWDVASGKVSLNK